MNVIWNNLITYQIIWYVKDI